MTKNMTEEEYYKNFPYTLVFRKNDNKYYYTNIYFESIKNEINFFKQYQTSHYFNKSEDQYEIMFQGNWFTSKKEANFILNILETKSNIVIIRNDHLPKEEKYIILTKKEYLDFQDKEIREKSTETKNFN